MNPIYAYLLFAIPFLVWFGWTCVTAPYMNEAV